MMTKGNSLQLQWKYWGVVWFLVCIFASCELGLSGHDCLTTLDCKTPNTECVRGFCKPVSANCIETTCQEKSQEARAPERSEPFVEPAKENVVEPVQEAKERPFDAVGSRRETQNDGEPTEGKDWSDSDGGVKESPAVEPKKEESTDGCVGSGCWPFWFIQVGDAKTQQAGRAIVGDTSGNIYISGTDGDALWLAKSNNKGQLLWQVKATKQNNASRFSNGQGLLITPGGTLWMIGDLGVGHQIEGRTSVSKGNNDKQNILLASFSLDGKLLSLDDPGGAAIDYGASITQDSQGNLYVAGTYQNKATLGTLSISGPGYREGFVAKIDSQGKWLWANGTTFDGTRKIWGAYGKTVAVDKDGSVITTGSFQHNTKLGSTVLKVEEHKDTYIGKLDKSGKWLWAKGVTGKRDESIVSVATDAAKNIYIAGDYNGTATFGTTTLTTSLSFKNIFVAKLDANGKWLWVKEYGQGGEEKLGRMVLTPKGDIYLAGTYIHGASFPKGNLFPAPGWKGRHVMILKLDKNGDMLWSNQAITRSFDTKVHGLFVNAKDHVFVTGQFAKEMRIKTTDIPQKGGDGEINLFAFQLDGNGKFR